MSGEYTADAIRVLSKDEVVRRFGFAKAGELASQFNKSRPWVERGLAACRDANVPEDYFIDRYIKGDHSVPANPTVDRAFRNLYLTKEQSSSRLTDKECEELLELAVEYPVATRLLRASRRSDSGTSGKD